MKVTDAEYAKARENMRDVLGHIGQTEEEMIRWLVVQEFGGMKIEGTNERDDDEQAE